MVITGYIVGLNQDVYYFVESISSRMERIHESSGLPQVLRIFIMEVDAQSSSRTRIKARVSLADGMLHTVAWNVGFGDCGIRRRQIPIRDVVTTVTFCA